MKMDGNLRVATEVKYKELYNNMKNIGAVDDFHELFFVCACIGYCKGTHVPLQKRDDRFWSRTILPQEWSCYYAMILEKHAFDYSRISDDKSVLLLIEGYANGGMEILLNDFLDDYLLPGSRGKEMQLDPSCCRELPKQFLHYIFEQSESNLNAHE